LAARACFSRLFNQLFSVILLPKHFSFSFFNYLPRRSPLLEVATCIFKRRFQMSSPAEKVFSLAKKAGISELTEIQKMAIPLVESGKDCLIIAPTGFGKTEAAVLPILSKIIALNEKSVAETGGDAPGVACLYITPLRALNRDLLSRLSSWCSSLGVSLAVRHGDTTQAQRKYQKENPPQFLITTPESLGAPAKMEIFRLERHCLL